MSIFNEIKDEQLDILSEVGNIGAGHAASALASLLNRKIDMAVPFVKVLSFEDLMDFFGGADLPVASIFLRMEGDLTGSIFFIMPFEQAEQFVRELVQDPAFDIDTIHEHMLGTSALHELGNILAGSYLSALADLTKLQLHPSVPDVTLDMFGAVISEGLMQFSPLGDQAIVIDTSIFDDQNQQELKGNMFLLPDFESFEKLFKALGNL
ncbi:chemotaxis protein CheC [Bacillus altitudinis MN12]|jgi:chemotaxis protein CheC|uniref:Chemotaxis protein CheC n=1 Tax=Bacillus aerius TaxID=293388 RepID=A0AB39J5Y2_9BACI|nr:MULTISPECIES: chemotaxis protein CheC [Bacillus]AHL71436.1 chemotaxis protein CheY [Bacillus pumilus]EMI13383.1 chemotaxis protein [Bacillus stratosphericus LAMA 585]KML03443.1 chemotaxis protein CheY [Bacillus stratosphericus]KQL47381.1 chemotaxis protein CheY [Bacillus sp. FJAT-21955]MBR3206483.1 chemotaxis protein CheC [Bacillus sp. (in: firmicutes)]MBW3699558.1 chemotaxis protein CheC [Bacillus aerophilus]MDH8710332.1 chemotaxis protein CheC [Micromonospora sp. 1209]CVM88833.1 CheY-P